MFIWTDEAIQCVKDLWGKQSAGEIAGIIGHPSRSAVCGKANRLGLSRIHKQKARATPFSKPRVQRFREVLNTGAADVEPLIRSGEGDPSVMSDCSRPGSLSCTLMELDESLLNTCRWPLWDDVVLDRYCGDRPVKGSPYCPIHTRGAWRRRGQ